MRCYSAKPVRGGHRKSKRLKVQEYCVWLQKALARGGGCNMESDASRLPSPDRLMQSRTCHFCIPAARAFRCLFLPESLGRGKGLLTVPHPLPYIHGDASSTFT